MSALYFAYGSNLDADQMRERCPSSACLGGARLAHHRLDFTHFSRRWRGGAADVVRDHAAHVWGALYRLDLDDLRRLDRFEVGYDRIDIRVVDVAELEHLAISYTVRAKQDTHAPHPHYLQKMIHWGRHWDFPTAYLEQLGEITVGPLDR